MQQKFFKSHAFRFVICLAFLFAAFMIHSCKKDIAGQQQSTITDPAVNTAKNWYQSTYPLATSTGSLVTQGTNNTSANFDFSQHITPDWSHASVYTRLGDNVTELPVNVSAKFSAALQNITRNKIVYKKEYSKSSFLLLNNGTGYTAYIMVIIADSSYLKNNLSKLSHNSYSKRDTDFSGMALYFTPKGNFVSGWLYKNGVLMPSANSGAAPATTKQVQSTGNAKLAPQYIEPICYDYSLVVYSNGVATSSEYLFTDCEGGDEAGGGTGTGGGSGSGGGVSGSGSSNGSSSAPSSSQYPPCPPGTQAPDATGKLVVNNVPAVPPSSGSGFPPPTSEPCETPIPTLQDGSSINSIMKNTSSLTDAQKAQLQVILNQILKDCIGQATFNYLTTNGDKFDFQINSNLAAQASYNPATDAIQINNTASVSSANLEEEFFHAYQNKTMQGGTTQYAGEAGSANIEFEAKLLRDIDYLINGQSAGNQWAVNGDDYLTWLSTITNQGTSFPTSFTSAQLTQYYLYMGDFLNQNPGYSSDIIKSGLNPTAMFNLIQNSSCSN